MAQNERRPSIRDRVKKVPVLPMQRAEGTRVELRITLNDGLFNIMAEDDSFHQVTDSREPCSEAFYLVAYFCEVVEHLRRESK